MNINIKKFCDISYIKVTPEKEQDLSLGITDILSYVDILNNINITSINSNNIKNYINIYRDSNINIKNQEQVKNIIFENAPLLIEHYFSVPNLITRK